MVFRVGAGRGRVMRDYSPRLVSDYLGRKEEDFEKRREDDEFESWLALSGASPRERELARARRSQPWIADVMDRRDRNEQEQEWKRENQLEKDEAKRAVEKEKAERLAAEEADQRGIADAYLQEAESGALTEEYDDPDSIGRMRGQPGVEISGGERVDPSPNDGRVGYTEYSPEEVRAGFGFDVEMEEVDGKVWGKDRELESGARTPVKAKVRSLGVYGQQMVEKARAIGKKYGFEVAAPAGFVGPDQARQMREREGAMLKEKKAGAEREMKAKKVHEAWGAVGERASDMGPEYQARLEGLRTLYPDNPQKAMMELVKDHSRSLGANEKKFDEFTKRIDGVRKEHDRAVEAALNARADVVGAGSAEYENEMGEKVKNRRYFQAKEKEKTAAVALQMARRKLEFLEGLGAEFQSQYRQQPWREAPKEQERGGGRQSDGVDFEGDYMSSLEESLDELGISPEEFGWGGGDAR